MPLEKFRGIESMTSPPVERDLDKLADRLEFLWAMARAGVSGHVRGVKKFRNLDEANADREIWIRTRARRLRSGPDDPCEGPDPSSKERP